MIGGFEQNTWNNVNQMGGISLHTNKNLFTPTGLSVIAIGTAPCNADKFQLSEIKEIIHEEADIVDTILAPIEKQHVQKKDKSSSKKSKKSKSSKSSKSSKKSKKKQ